MKVLVTGAAGFIGSHLVKALVKQGESVFGLVRDKRKATFLDSLGVKLIKGDIQNKRSIEEAVKGMNIVYHLAAISGKSAIPASLYQEVNIQGTKNMIEASLKARVSRFIFTSTVAVTGRLAKIPGDETSCYQPTNWYEKSKVEGEKLVLAAIKKGLPSVVIRPGVVYGPGNTGSNMAQFFKMAAKGFCIIPGNGENLWDMIYIDDCVQGFILAGKKKEALGEVFIIAGPKPVTVNEVVKALAQAAGVKLKLWHLPVLPMMVMGKIFGLIENTFYLPMPFSDKIIELLSQSRPHSIKKAKKVLGYQPKVYLKEGIAKTVSRYKAIGFI